MTSPASEWLQLDNPTSEQVSSLLSAVDDDLWVTAACVDKLADDVHVQRTILDVGLERSKKIPSSIELALSSNDPRSSLEAHFQDIPSDAQICSYRTILLERLKRLNTYVEICRAGPGDSEGADATEEEEEEESATQDDEDDISEEWEDDPWAEITGENEEDSSAPAPDAPTKSSTKPPPVPLSAFLTDGLVQSACTLASHQWFNAVQVMYTRHASTLWPYRLTLLTSIPDYAQPALFRHLLLTYDPVSNQEDGPPPANASASADWVENPFIQEHVQQSQLIDPLAHIPAVNQRLSADDLLQWYRKRINSVLNTTGLVDIALATVQHGASQGLPGLDELGEELNLFSRLVYDTNLSALYNLQEEWSLERWRALSPSDAVRAYLASSTQDTVVQDIQKLVLPYLYVVEARLERSQKPNPNIANELLFEYILSAPLPLVAAILEASKPTLPASQRLIRRDEDMVRLALACLYASDSCDQWATMSRIFECLPAWNISADDAADEDIAATTVTSLSSFLAPSTGPRCTANDLLVFFKPLPPSSLSRVLDILDVHLESGEVLARWSVPAPLRWFLQSSDSDSEQRAWANRMARQAGGSVHKVVTPEDWEWLLEDMLKLSGKSENGIKGAFGLLERKEVKGIFLSALLSLGHFETAKSLLYARKPKLTLNVDVIEEICITSSHELYDNATSGNYKLGDMKLAYDCLSVPKQTERILKEKEFIEATSRLSSYNITSRGNPITPIEIRMTKDKLSLVSRLLSSNPEAYKHTEVILDLVYKLGLRNDPVAEIKTLAMLAEAGLQAEDFTRAYEICERMVGIVVHLRSQLPYAITEEKVAEASEVCWVSCFQLGRQPEFHDVDKKMILLGYTLEICPKDRIHDVLNAWRREEKEDMSIREDRMAQRRNQRNEKPSKPISIYDAPVEFASLASRLQDFRMPAPPLLNTPDAAALASRTFKQVTANFPFSRGRSAASSSQHERSDSPLPVFDSGAMSEQASRVVSKGLGWLLGDE